MARPCAARIAAQVVAGLARRQQARLRPPLNQRFSRAFKNDDFPALFRPGAKDTSFFELYFVFGAVWACGAALSISGGVDHRREFSQWWRSTWKSVKFPSYGDVFDYYVSRRTQDFELWAESVSAPPFNSATTHASAVTVPTGETAAGSTWRQPSMRAPLRRQTQANLEVWRASAQPEAQPWQVGGLARLQKSRFRPPSERRFSRVQPGALPTS